MPVMISLTNAEHGGTATCGTGNCGPSCECGCPYTGLEERGRVETIATVEQSHPNEWLAFVIPPGEDEFAPDRGMLVVHSPDDQEVWDAVAKVTHNQVVHVYFNGDLDTYLDWAQAPEESSFSLRLGGEAAQTERKRTFLEGRSPFQTTPE